jgi:hypothetical protein
MPRAKPRRMNRQRILEEVRKTGSFLGSSGVDRRNLFVRPQEGAPLKCHVLPDLRERGTSGELFPFLALTTHWVERTKRDGSKFTGGITCYRALKEEEPHAYQYLTNEKLIDPKRDADCVPCIILDSVDESELPHGKYGISFQGRRAFHLQVVLDRSEYTRDDTQIIKIMSTGATGKRSFMESLCDEDLVDDGFFEENGIYSSWKHMGKSIEVTLYPKKSCWYQEWADKMHDLELVVPVTMTYDEQIATMVDNIPQHAALLNQLANGGPKLEIVEPKPPPKRKRVPARKKTAQKRVKKAR